MHAARGIGWTSDAVRHGVRRGELLRPQRGVVQRADGGHPGTPRRVVCEIANLSRARAAALQCPRATVSHLSAAVADGIPTYGSLERACLTVPAGTALRRLARVHLHRATLRETECVTRDGYRITAPARTVFDIAREFGVDAGVVAADFVLHNELASAAELDEAFELCRTWPGRRAARITLLGADSRAESPLESLSRLRIASSHLPAPTPQQEICDSDGRFLGRCDFYWDEFGVFGEVDGALKYRDGDPGAIVAAERQRHALLEGTGLIGVRWGWPDLYTFDDVTRRLTIAFARGARSGSVSRRWGLLVR
ncbi:MAG: hypothetical protein QOH89_3274 [Pseudonocardiales bacterium]|nr:hypothetical protein [Pseudonocardiales bacterium]